MNLSRLFNRLARNEAQRRHPRNYDRPMHLLIEGRQYGTEDWSLGGFRIADYDGRASVGEQIQGTQMASADTHLRDFRAEVVWRSATREIGARFLEFGGAAI